MFEEITLLSPLDAQGYLTLTMATAYLEGRVLKVTQNEFWNCMSVFLSRRNQRIMKQREMKRRKAGRSR